MMNSSTVADGVWPVMLTPFREDGSIDWDGVDALVDWYIAAGSAGIFTVCLSSEMYELTPEERLELAARVVQRAAGRVPVVASGTFGGPIPAQAQFVKEMAATGVTAVVVVTCQLAARDQSDAEWLAAAEQLVDATGAVPLGLYECPVPYKRVLGGELIRWAAATGRFVYHKDTSASRETIREEIRAADGSPLRIFNACTRTLLDSLLAGGAGYSGIAANFHPELFAWMCAHFRDHREKAVLLQQFLSVADLAIQMQYPHSAKQYLRLLGAPFSPVCRVPEKHAHGLDEQGLRHLAETVHSLCDMLGISPAKF